MKKNIEAFARYHQAKESLAEYAQIGTAAIRLLRTNVAVPNGGRLLGQFVDACEVVHWSENRNFHDPVTKATQIGEMLSHQVLVQQVAAFDLFSNKVISDFGRFSEWARENCDEIAHDHCLSILSPQGRWVISPCCYELENKLGDLKYRLDDLQRILKWKPTDKLKSIFPLFDLARMARNRIVHCDGVVGSDLADFSSSDEVKESLKAFRKNYSKADFPPLPRWDRACPLYFSPSNAIFFGAIIYEFAKEINIYVSSKLTDDEFIDMSFFYSTFVETHSARTIRHRSAEARIKHFLSSRYLFKAAPQIKDVCSRLKAYKFSAGKNKPETTAWKIALERHEQLAKSEEAVDIPKIDGGAKQEKSSESRRKVKKNPKKSA